MNALSAIILDELRRQRALLGAAVVLGLLPLALPLLPRSATVTPAVLAVALAVSFALVASMVLGSGLLSRDLAEGRLGFYLRLPVSEAALWFGRLGAAVVCLLLLVIAVLTPTALVYGLLGEFPEASPLVTLSGGWLPHVDSLGVDLETEMRLARGLPIVAGGLVLLLLAGHVGGMALRRRDAWTLLAMGAAALSVMVIMQSIYGLLRADATTSAVKSLMVIGCGFVALVSLGGWMQLRRAGVDPARSHGILSLTLWPAMLLFSGAVAWNVSAILEPTLDDLDRILEVQPVGESWVKVSGRVEASGLLPTFVHDLESDRSYRLGSFLEVSPVLMTATSPRRLLWIRCERLLGDHENRDRSCSLWALDVEPARTEGANAQPYDMGIGFSPVSWPQQTMALEPSGRYLAVLHGGLATIVDLNERRVVRNERFSTRRPAATIHGIGDGHWFVNRLLNGPESEPRQRFHLSVAEGLEAIYPGPPDVAELESAADAVAHRTPRKRVVEHRREDGVIELINVERGSTEMTIDAPAEFFSDALVLEDGGVAFIEGAFRRDSREVALVVYDSTGERIGTLPFAGYAGYIGSQPSPGTLWLGVARSDHLDTSRRCGQGSRMLADFVDKAAVLVDLRTMTVLRTVEDVLPLNLDIEVGASGSDWLMGCDGWPQVITESGVRPVITR